MDANGLNFIMQIISYPATIMNTILAFSGTWYIWFGAVFLVMIIRFFIMPLSASKFDNVSQPKENVKNRGNK